jgi:LmbE family N-acetylglucosaminyl deacetylase
MPSLLTAPPVLGNTVGIMAHPDDLFYAAAGILCEQRRRGHHVASISATSGDLGSLDHNRWAPCDMAAIREDEEATAQRLIGVHDTRFLRFGDGTLHLVPFEAGVATVLRHTDELQPDTWITYAPDGLTGHLDHQVISAWTTAAFQRSAKPGARLLYVVATPEWHDLVLPLLHQARAIYDPGPRIVPDSELYIDHRLSDSTLATKLAGIEAFTSQSDPLADMVGGLHRLQPWFRRETLVQAVSF